MSGPDVFCDYGCHFTPKYGFVPEEGCPVHDAPKGYIPLGDPRLDPPAVRSAGTDNQ